MMSNNLEECYPPFYMLHTQLFPECLNPLQVLLNNDQDIKFLYACILSTWLVVDFPYLWLFSWANSSVWLWRRIGCMTASAEFSVPASVLTRLGQPAYTMTLYLVLFLSKQTSCFTNTVEIEWGNESWIVVRRCYFQPHNFSWISACMYIYTKYYNII